MQASVSKESVVPNAVFPRMILNEATRTAIASMGISDPTPIQDKSIPHLLEGRDLIGQACTGSGKTLAFSVPMIEQCESTGRQPQALVLVPTRELAVQVGGVIEELARPQGLHVTLLYGGRSVGNDYKALKRGAADYSRHSRPHSGSCSPGQFESKIGPIPGAGRGRRDAGPRFRRRR